MTETWTTEEYKEYLKLKGKKLKYGNKINDYNGGKYHSKFESEFAQILDFRLKAKDIQSWDRQVKIEINVKIIDNVPILTDETGIELKEKGIPYHHIDNYFMDFVVFNNDDTEDWVECKGLELSLWKTKFSLTEAIFRKYPERKLIVLKDKQNKYAAKNNLKFTKNKKISFTNN